MLATESSAAIISPQGILAVASHAIFSNAVSKIQHKSKAERSTDLGIKPNTTWSNQLQDLGSKTSNKRPPLADIQTQTAEAFHSMPAKGIASLCAVLEKLLRKKAEQPHCNTAYTNEQGRACNRHRMALLTACKG